MGATLRGRLPFFRLAETIMKDNFPDLVDLAGADGALVVVLDGPAPPVVDRKPRKAKAAKPHSRALHKRRKKKVDEAKARRVAWLDRPKYEPLTPADVDPEFTGTPVEFTDKYGHVQALTGEQYATDRFNAWAANLRVLAKAAKNAPGWPKVDHDWLRNPSPHFIGKMADALDHLRPIIAEAEALLARAQAVEEAKRPTLHQPDAESLPTG